MEYPVDYISHVFLYIPLKILNLEVKDECY